MRAVKVSEEEVKRVEGDGGGGREREREKEASASETEEMAVSCSAVEPNSLDPYFDRDGSERTGGVVVSLAYRVSAKCPPFSSLLLSFLLPR